MNTGQMLALGLALGTAPLAMSMIDVESKVKLIEQRNSDNPFATYSVDALSTQNVGGCYKAPSLKDLAESATQAAFTFTEEELTQAREGIFLY